MKNIYTIITALLIGGATFSQTPNWTVNSANYSLDLSITGKLNFQGTNSIDVQDKVGAFDSQGNVRGIANVVYDNIIQDYFINLTVLSNGSSDSIFFKVYDASQDSIYNAVNEAVIFTPNAVIGSVGSPYVVFATNAPYNMLIDNQIIVENDSVNALIGDLWTDVPDTTGITFFYTLVAGIGDVDNASFMLIGGQVRAAFSYDFETKSNYSIRVKTITNENDSMESVFAISITDVNEIPTDLVLNYDSIPENGTIGDTIGMLSTVDEDGNETFIYTIDTAQGTDFSFFSINNNQLIATAIYDYEIKNNYSINITSTDLAGLDVTQQFTVFIKDVYEPTTITLSNFTIAENEGIRALVGQLLTSEPLAYSFSLISGTGDSENAYFSIQNDSLVADSVFNFETTLTNPLSVLVQSMDGNGNTENQAFLITVTDVNEMPTDLVLSYDSISENNIVGDTIGLLTTLDEDGNDVFSYSLDTSYLTSFPYFSINGNALIVDSIFDFEMKESYVISIISTNQLGAVISNQFTIIVGDVYEPNIITLSNQYLNENEVVGAVVAKLLSSEPLAYSFSLATGLGDSENAYFLIQNDSLIIDSNLDYETLSPNPMSVLIASTDSNGNTEKATFLIQINDINEAPMSITLSYDSVFENGLVADTIGLLTTTDQDAGETFTYTIDSTPFTDYAKFEVINNVLRAKTTFDFELKDSYIIDITTTDLGGLSLTQQYIIYIKDVFESINLLLTNQSINENEAIGTAIGIISDNGGAGAYTYNFTNGLGDNNNTGFTISNDTLKSAVIFNYETLNSNVLSVLVQSDDGAGILVNQIFSILINDVNEAPTAMALSNDSITENNMINDTIGWLSTTDEDLFDVHIYTIDSTQGTDFNAFKIQGNALLANINFDYEIKTSYLVDITSKDAQGEVITTQYNIGIRDVYDPILLSLTNTVVNENEAIETMVGVLSNTIAGVYSFNLVAGIGDTANAEFLISNDTLFTASIFNYEALVSNPKSILIEATNNVGTTGQQIFEIAIADVNDVPTMLVIDNDTIIENNNIGDLIGNLTTIDEDANDNFTYELLATPTTDFADFTIVSNALQVTSSFDFEIKNQYIIDVKTTDLAGATLIQQLTIRIANVYEPTAISLSNMTINENDSIGSLVGGLLNDGASIYTYTYSFIAGTGDDNNTDFLIENNQLKTATNFNFETLAANPLSVLIQSADNNGDTVQQVFTIEILNINEAPTILLLSNDSIFENNAIADVVGVLFTTDEDLNESFTYEIVATPFTDFADFVMINNNLHTFIVFDFETKNQYVINIKTTDMGGITLTQSFVITIKDIYESTTISLSSSVINENETIGAFVGDLSNNGSSVYNYTYALVAGSGDDNNNDFTIVNNTLLSASDFDFETLNNNPLSILITSTNNNGSTEQQVFLIDVVDKNDAPTELTLSYDSIMENNAVGDTIAMLSTTDEDTLDTTFIYTIESTPFTDYEDFVVVDNALRTYIAFDYEVKNQYLIDVTSTDASGASITQTITIYIIDDETEVFVGINGSTGNNNFKIFPNPSNGIFQIGNLKNKKIKIHNILGAEVDFDKVRNTISLQNVDKGIYFISIIEKGVKNTQRVVIN